MYFRRTTEEKKMRLKIILIFRDEERIQVKKWKETNKTIEKKGK